MPVPHVPSLYLLLAAVSFVLAILGVFLPVLPTTPFVLLTSWCLVRSSPRLDARLRSTRWFGPLIADWERERGLRAGAKRAAYFGMALGGSISLAYGDLSPLWTVVLFASVGYGAWFVWRLPNVQAANIQNVGKGGVPTSTSTLEEHG